MRKIKYKKGKRLQPYVLEYTGSHKNIASELQLFVYDDKTLSEYEAFKLIHLDKFLVDDKVNWLNIHGLNSVEWLQAIGDYFSIDNFMLADILNTVRRTKLEETNDCLFFNIKSLLPSEGSDTIEVEQISFLLKKDVLLSFQEKRSDFFLHIRERIRSHSGLVRGRKADYLLYILLDSIMENFYITLENEEDKVEELIDMTKENPDPVILERIEKHRDNFNFLKRSIIPLRDSLYEIKSIKDDTVFNEIQDDTFSFFARLHQKSLELLEQIDSDMDTLESASNFFFSAQTHKMNEVMKTLTIVSSIFIPLTFIVGVYGMNFENMPELKSTYGYPIVMGVMFLLVIGMIVYFKKRRWF